MHWRRQRHPAQSPRLPRPAHVRGYEGVSGECEIKERGVRHHGHPVHELQHAVPTLCHEEGGQYGAEACRKAAVPAGCAELDADGGGGV